MIVWSEHCNLKLAEACHWFGVELCRKFTLGAPWVLLAFF